MHSPALHWLLVQIVACHVDYGNRPESGAEADFVEQWCGKYGIHFKKRRIEEVRGIAIGLLNILLVLTNEETEDRVMDRIPAL
jgi:hypothetical protein